MRAQGLQGRAAKRWRKTTIADPEAAARADRIRRDFIADASKLNTRWCGGITYIPARSRTSSKRPRAPRPKTPGQRTPGGAR
jgi:hypothetical protein